MERRLELVEEQLQIQGNASICDRASIISSGTTGSDHTIRAGDSNNSSATLASNSSYQHAFEELLNSSWVYRRNKNREEDMSMRSSVLRMSAWSVLSDMSLANISIIAVMSLPVQIQELSNGGWYSSDSHSLAPETEEAIGFSRLSGSKDGQADDANQTSERDRQREIFERESREQAKQFKAWMKVKSEERRLASGNAEAETQQATTSSTSSTSSDEIEVDSKSSKPQGFLPDIPTHTEIGSDLFKEMLEEARRIGQEHSSAPTEGDEEADSEPRERDLIDQILDEEEDDEIYPCKGCGEVGRISDKYPRQTDANLYYRYLRKARHSSSVSWILVEGCDSLANDLPAGNRWHIECFKCNTCGVLLDSDANLLVGSEDMLIPKTIHRSLTRPHSFSATAV